MRRLHLAVLIAVVCAVVSLAGQRGPSTGAARSGQGTDLFQKALSKERVDGQLTEALALYERIVNDFAADRALVARALVQMGRCYERLGKTDAKRAYERVVQEFPDQKASATEARARLAEIDRAGSSAAGAMSARRVWAGRDVRIEGGVPADGRYLSTMDRATGDLAIRDLTTGQTRRLFAKPRETVTEEYAEASIPSPDGARIVYQWFNSQNFYELRTIGLTDAQPRTLYSQANEYVRPAGWSPDGKRVLAIIGRDRTNQLVWISTVDKSQRLLKTLDWRYAIGVRVSPDGRFLVYDFPAGPDATERDIFLLHTDGSREIRLVQHSANDFQPIWTPDGNGVLFTSDRTGTESLWLIRVTGGAPQGPPTLVKANTGQTSPLGFSRNGAYYYGLRTGAVDAYVLPLDPGTGKPSGAPMPLSDRFVGANSNPDWSPDGTSLLYLAQRGAGFTGALDPARLTLRSLATSAERVLPVKIHMMHRPRWSPDGRSILAWGSDDEKSQEALYRIDVESGRHSAIFPPRESYDIEGEWSPDGRAIFYQARDATGSRVLRRALDADAEPQELYRAPTAAALAGLSLSPDGRQLAFRLTDVKTGASVLIALPATGGEPIELVRLGKGESISRSVVSSVITWTPAGDAVLFVKRIETGTDASRNELWRVSLATRRAESLDFVMPAVRDIRIRPDGRALAVAAGEYQAEVWVMEAFLPATSGKAPTSTPRGGRR